VDKLFFKTDPLTGNKKFRSEIIFALAIVLGIGFWIALELKGNDQDTIASTDLNLQTGTIAAVGEQQIGINEDIRNLVSTTPDVPEIMPEGNLNTAAVPTPKEKINTQTTSAPATTSKPKTSFGIDVYTPPAKAAPETQKENDDEVAPPKPVDWDALQKQVESPSSGGSSSGSYNNSYAAGNNSSGTTKSGSAVAFKREDDKTIQQRDGQQFDNLPGLPAGTIIPCEILTGIISGDTLPVILYVTKDVLYNQAVVIPKGSLLLGTAQANFEARRIFVSIDRLIIGNAEITVKGQVQDGSGRAGLCDRYVDNSKGTLVAGFFAGLLSEFGKAFTSKASLIQVGGETSTTDTAKGAFLAGTSSGLDAVAATLAEKAAAQKAVMIAYPNRMTRVILEQKIPLEWLLKATGK
jgi:hypothetical protein